MTDQGRSIPTASAVKTVPAAGAALATENGSRAGLRADLPVMFDSGVGGISGCCAGSWTNCPARIFVSSAIRQRALRQFACRGRC